MIPNVKEYEIGARSGVCRSGQSGDGSAAFPLRAADGQDRRRSRKRMWNAPPCFCPSHSTYFASYFTITGLHGLHVLGGVLVFIYMWLPVSRKLYSKIPSISPIELRWRLVLALCRLGLDFRFSALLSALSHEQSARRLAGSGRARGVRPRRAQARRALRDGGRRLCSFSPASPSRSSYVEFRTRAEGEHRGGDGSSRRSRPASSPRFSCISRRRNG